MWPRAPRLSNRATNNECFSIQYILVMCALALLIHSMENIYFFSNSIGLLLPPRWGRGRIVRPTPKIFSSAIRKQLTWEVRGGRVSDHAILAQWQSNPFVRCRLRVQILRVAPSPSLYAVCELTWGEIPANTNGRHGRVPKDWR